MKLSRLWAGRSQPRVREKGGEMSVDEEQHIFGSWCWSFYEREVGNRFPLDKYKEDIKSRGVMVTTHLESWGVTFVNAF